MESAKVKNILESLLFVARKPVTLVALEEATALPKELLAACLEEMIGEYQPKGVKVFKVAGGYLMGTDPANAEYVEKVLHPREETTLSGRALETLAIISYKQPVTKAEIERLRGVNSDGVVDTLLAKKMVREIKRSDAVGHPYLYGTTPEFLRHFGLHSLVDLPPLPDSVAEQDALFKSALREDVPVE
ncbi:MAG TPA: SMC-Scp complex subunit ScpB [Candidatus Sulfotelmatobacter sp.]|nr:SMC-Scp complex subunit ScpB [Candidatus Sulfotelmatobacter sp.]